MKLSLQIGLSIRKLVTFLAAPLFRYGFPITHGETFHKLISGLTMQSILMCITQGSQTLTSQCVTVRVAIGQALLNGTVGLEVLGVQAAALQM